MRDKICFWTKKVFLNEKSCLFYFFGVFYLYQFPHFLYFGFAALRKRCIANYQCNNSSSHEKTKNPLPRQHPVSHAKKSFEYRREALEYALNVDRAIIQGGTEMSYLWGQNAGFRHFVVISGHFWVKFSRYFGYLLPLS